MARPPALVERFEPVRQDLDVRFARRVLDVEAQARRRGQSAFLPPGPLRVEPPGGADDALHVREPSNDRLERQLTPMVRSHGRGHLDPAGSAHESAVHLAEVELRHGPNLLHELSADLGRARRPAFNRDDIMLLFLRHLHRLAIDGADDRPHSRYWPRVRGPRLLGHKAPGLRRRADRPRPSTRGSPQC